MLGDNLGVNEVLGFAGSFSATYYCRFCTETKKQHEKSTSEHLKSLRNINNYEEAIRIDNVSLTGVVTRCILNEIPSFHVTSNFFVDAMHDVFEGISHYDMSQIMKYIVEAKFVSSEKLNDRIASFNYGDILIGNIAINRISHTNMHIQKTASEMMTFIDLFPMMVGDLIPQNDEIWVFLLNLVEMVDLILSCSFSFDSIARLKSLIRTHNLDYVRLFNDNLKPKMHILVHYPSIIAKCGPPRNYWCFAYEAKHKDFKQYANAFTSRCNIPLTLALKFQFKFAHFLLQIERTALFTIAETHRIRDSMYSAAIEKFQKSCCMHGAWKTYSECNYRGKRFKRGYYVCEEISQVNASDAKIYNILEIPYVYTTHLR